MPAPNLPTLFDFEGQFEAAAQAVLTANGITSYLSQAKSKLPLLETAIALDVGPAIDELTQIPSPTSWPADQAPPQEYFRYPATLGLEVNVPRDDNGATLPGVTTLLSQIRGQIRAAFMRVVFPFNDSNLPYLRVSDIRPAGSLTAWRRETNVDFTSLRFAITFSIQPSAWPTWIET